MDSQRKSVFNWRYWFLYHIVVVQINGMVYGCREDQFECLDGSGCIRLEYHCDYSEDCDDNSDERDCPNEDDLVTIQDNFLLLSITKDNDSSSDTVHPQIYQIEVGTAHSKHLLSTHPQIPASLAIDYRRKLLYYVDYSVAMIVNVSLDQVPNTGQVIFRDPTITSRLDGLAIDTTTQRLYYADSGTSPKIVVIDLTTEAKTRRTIYSGTDLKPKGLVVDEANCELYWTDWGTTPGIFVIGCEPGATRKSLITHDIVIPNALAIDFRAETMFWIDAQLDRIEMAKLDGRDRQVLLRESGDPHYYALAIGPQYLYIADWSRQNVLLLDRQSNTTKVQMPILRGKKTGLAYYSSTFNNTGRRRPDRMNVTTLPYAQTITTTATKSIISSTLRSSTTRETSDSKYIPTKVDEKTTKKIAQPSANAEKHEMNSGSNKETFIIVGVVISALFLLIVSLAIWFWAHKRHGRQMGDHYATYIKQRPSPVSYSIGSPMHRRSDVEYLCSDDSANNHNNYEPVPEPPDPETDHYMKNVARINQQCYLPMVNEPEYEKINHTYSNPNEKVDFYDNTA